MLGIAAIRSMSVIRNRRTDCGAYSEMNSAVAKENGTATSSATSAMMMPLGSTAAMPKSAFAMTHSRRVRNDQPACLRPSADRTARKIAISSMMSSAEAPAARSIPRNTLSPPVVADLLRRGRSCAGATGVASTDIDQPRRNSDLTRLTMTGPAPVLPSTNTAGPPMINAPPMISNSGSMIRVKPALSGSGLPNETFCGVFVLLVRSFFVGADESLFVGEELELLGLSLELLSPELLFEPLPLSFVPLLLVSLFDPLLLPSLVGGLSLGGLFAGGLSPPGLLVGGLSPPDGGLSVVQDWVPTAAAALFVCARCASVNAANPGASCPGSPPYTWPASEPT